MGIYAHNQYNMYRKMKHEDNRNVYTGSGDVRGVSTVIGVVILVMITAMVAGAFTVSALGFTDNLEDEPTLGECKLPSQSATPTNVCDERVANLETNVDYLGSTGGEVKVHHIFGEPIASENVRIEIDAPGGTATMEGINEDGITDATFCWYNSDECRLKDATVDNYEDPENIIDSGGDTSKIPAVMEEGDTMYFRLSNSAKMTEGTTTLTVTHPPSGTELINEPIYDP